MKSSHGASPESVARVLRALNADDAYDEREREASLDGADATRGGSNGAKEADLQGV